MRLPTHRAPTSPGEMLLKEFLEPMGITQKQLADHLGWTYAKVNEIVHNKRGITAETALGLADAFACNLKNFFVPIWEIAKTLIV